MLTRSVFKILDGLQSKKKTKKEKKSKKKTGPATTRKKNLISNMQLKNKCMVYSYASKRAKTEISSCG
jgi:hypothetical protein